ncbi:hypothetical protein NDU88_003018 [Pleurodeles waltl]|uniref:Uncharacterized protein n=1 Tax=Pleurodeles waltl TaxID=8319 RepID=A0AAV7MXC0_PLEWA|nr:hypothetical protein NDU88_003018 [Pleurodeles waltl]
MTKKHRHSCDLRGVGTQDAVVQEAEQRRSTRAQGAYEAQVQSRILVETILKELQELKNLQQKETAAIKQRLNKIEEAMGQIPACLQKLKQRISDLEDRSLAWDNELDRVQKKLYESQNKIEAMENYARRSNLYLVGVLEGAEKQGNHQDMLQFMDALIKSHSLENPPANLTIIRVH